jgi:hypothetical protein
MTTPACWPLALWLSLAGADAGTDAGTAQLVAGNMRLDRTCYSNVGNDAGGGDPINLTITVTNNGTAPGDMTVRISGAWVKSQDVTVPAGESRDVVFQTTAVSLGDWDVQCTACTGTTSVTIVVRVTCPAAACADGTQSGTCSTTLPGHCSNGTLADRCSVCSCPPGSTCNATTEGCDPLPSCDGACTCGDGSCIPPAQRSMYSWGCSSSSVAGLSSAVALATVFRIRRRRNP